MAASTMTLNLDDRGGFFGHSFVRLTIAAIMAVIVIGAISSAASARTATTTMGQHDFVSQCRAGGGTSKRLGTHVVQCTTGGGQVVTCDFNTTPASCIIAFIPQHTGPLGPVVTGGVLEQVDADPIGPVRPGQTGTVGGGVVQRVDAAPIATDVTVTTGDSVQVIEVAAIEEPVSSPDPSPAPESQAAPLPGGVVAVQSVVDVAEDGQS